MARPIRIDLTGGWYHVINRGIERQPIFKTAEDYDHFVTVAGTMPARFGIRVHAYALLSSHYHLLVETPDGNLSQALRWLNVSYSGWFNRKYRRVGPLFQGRFKAFIVEPAGPHLEISRYIHLNPLQTLRYRSGRSLKKPAATTGADMTRERVSHLRSYPWSSYASYLELRARPPWLETDGILSNFEESTGGRRHATYRKFVEEPVRQGTESTILDRALTGLAIGSPEFVAKVHALAKGDSRSVELLHARQNRVGWEQIKRAVSEVKGELWESFVERRGDSGRDLALLVGRRFGCLTLRELGKFVGITYAAVAQSVARIERSLLTDKRLEVQYSTVARKLKMEK
jgi:REP-associated tyrosine transposase